MIFLKENSLRNAVADENQSTLLEAIKALQPDKSQRNCGKMIYNFKKINRNKSKILIQSLSALQYNSSVGKKDLEQKISNKQNIQVIKNKKRTLTSTQSLKKKFFISLKERRSQNQCKNKVIHPIEIKSVCIQKIENRKKEKQCQNHGRANSCQAIKSLKLLRSISRNKISRNKKNSRDNFEESVQFHNILLSATVRQERKKGWRGRNCLTFGQQFLQIYRQKIKITGAKAPQSQTAEYFKLKPSLQKQRQASKRQPKIKHNKIITECSQNQSSCIKSRRDLHLFFSDI